MPAFLFLEKTLPPRPYRLSVGEPDALGRGWRPGVTVIVGPNVSSVTAALRLGTSARITGPT